jgi:polyphosphate kinase
MHLSAEASWLQFNRRVLLQTERPDFPLLERLQFLGIWASNADEFFAARISRVFADQRGSQEYLALLAEALEQARFAEQQYQKFLRFLEPLGIRLYHPVELSRNEQRYFGAFLAEQVAPRTDLIPLEALSDLSSRALYFASGDDQLRYLIRLPDQFPRLLPIPGRDGGFIRLGELVRFRADLFTPNPGHLAELRIVRLSALERKEVDWDELPAAVEGRLDGQVSHLEIEHDFPPLWAQTVREALGLYPQEVFSLHPPLDLRLVHPVVTNGPVAFKFPDPTPEQPKSFLKNPWSYLDQRDLLLYHPYQDYGAVESFANLAARDPKVTLLRATLYRLGPQNQLAEALITAAKAGKDVAVLLEGRASFDELQNLYWGLRFRGAGVRVLPLPSKKVHAKALLVQREGQLFGHLGTGNYNAVNAARYTDLSLFTSRKSLCEDIASFFRALEQRQAPQLSHIRTGVGIRETLVQLILAEAHPKGQVILKFNHLTDSAVLEALREAAQKGARVDLIIRTTLTEREPGFRMRSLVGRYLEHARLAAFYRKGEWSVWASSADGMPRNIDRRYELFFPITHLEAKKQIIRLLKQQLKDDSNTFVLDDQGQQKAVWGGKHNAQRIP